MFQPVFSSSGRENILPPGREESSSFKKREPEKGARRGKKGDVNEKKAFLLFLQSMEINDDLFFFSEKNTKKCLFAPFQLQKRAYLWFVTVMQTCSGVFPAPLFRTAFRFFRNSAGEIYHNKIFWEDMGNETPE